MEKRDLRKKCFAVLRDISEEEKVAQSDSICRLLARLPVFKSARVVLSFIALNKEPELADLMWSSIGIEKTWGFSVVEANDVLTFRKVDDPDKQLAEGNFGIREPIKDLCPKIDLKKVDLVLIPGVGFDPKTGARLGRGKGHYDRFLSTLLDCRESALQPMFIGVGFSQQLCELAPEPHDIPMNTLLTDSGNI